jgi:subtilisin family serine protease
MFIFAVWVLSPQAIAQKQLDGPDIGRPDLRELRRLAQESSTVYLHLASGKFDPLTESPAVPNFPQITMESIPATESVYYLVQMKGPITEDHKKGLTEAGARIFDYIPEFAFIVKMSGRARAIVETLGTVRWVGVYQPGYRVGPKLLDRLSLSVPAKRMELIVVTFAEEDVDLIADQLRAMDGEILDVTTTKWKGKIKVRINSSRVPQMSELTGVKWIEEAPVWELHNDVAREIMNVDPVWNPHHLQGEGQVVAVADTGLDQGSKNPANLHDDFEDGAGNTRVIQIFDRVGDGSQDVNSGHGTHVAGSVLGNGSHSGDMYAGPAPEARLIFQAVEDNTDETLSGIPTDLNVLFDQARTAGADIHTNSWGASLAGDYSSECEDVDENVWDNKDFTILFSAGNSGVDSNADGIIDLYSLGSPAAAKNCITVGASENNRPSGSTPTPGYDMPWATGSWAVKYPSNPIASDHVSNNPEGMAAFSSRGPCLDGRTKPDLVAPGTNIASTLSSLVSPPDLWGTGGLTGGLEDFYVFSGGTSMSTPLVAGAAALVREFYTDQGVSPSSALIKATLINGAKDLSGQYAGLEVADSPRPNQDEGWGRVDLQNSLFPDPPRQMVYQDIDSGLTTNGTDTYSVEVVDGSNPLRVTLVWTDYPGSTVAGGGLVNDLDLSVIDPSGTTHYPNGASQHGMTEVLSYDDGIPDNGYSWSGGRGLAVRFTPTSYPVKLHQALFPLSARTGYGYPRNFTANVWDDDGPGGSPGTNLGSVSSTIRTAGWYVVDFSKNNIRISDGDFYIEVRFSDSYLVLLFDDDAPIDGRSWDFNGTSWSQWTEEDYMIRAIIASPDYVAPYDRVNNVEGVDVEAPLTLGPYTIRVQGFNVAHGPQPYALVISGGIQIAPVDFITNTDSILVLEGGTATFQVKLSAQPSATVNASVAWFSGDTDITVQSGSSLTFTTANWNTYQPVTLRAAEDADMDNGTATIRISASGVSNTKDVTATETDNDIVNFITNTDSVAVREGKNATFRVKLSARPSSAVNASVALLDGGDADIRVKSGASLTFTTANWNVYQKVVLSDAEDPDTVNGTVTIRISGSGVLNDKDVTATEVDNDMNLLTPGDGEIIPSGSPYTLTWEAPDHAVRFKLQYSADNGGSWVKITDDAPGASYSWQVPTLPNNRRSCLVKVTGYDASEKKVVQDRSDRVFTIEVVKVTSPNGNEFLSCENNPYTVTWVTNGTATPVTTVILSYTKDGGAHWSPIANISGNPGNHSWPVPCLNASKSKCRVKLVLKDADGKTVGSDSSDDFFTITP